MLKYFLIAVITLLCTVNQIDAASKESEKFRSEEIFPDILDDLPELKPLKIRYPSDVEVNLGNVLTPTQVKDSPKVEYDADEEAYFTLLMTDPDAPSRKEPTRREYRHWLTINIRGKDLKSGEEVVQYIGSGPPKDTGLHRYVFLLFKQPKDKLDYDTPLVSDHSSLGRASTSTRDFISQHKLQLVAGNFYQAEYDDYVPTLHAQLSGKKE